MLCQVQDNIVDSLKALKGELLQLNRYRHGDNTNNDGFVITGASDYYFIETKTKIIGNKYQLHVLVIDQVYETELNDEINFETVDEGELSEIHLFTHSLENINVDRNLIPRITSECALILNFGNGNNMIYPEQKLFGNSSLETDTDKILDIMNNLKLKHSRSL